MIAFEELKSLYQENMDLVIGVVGQGGQDSVYSLDLTWDFKKSEEVTNCTLNEDNLFQATIPILFTLMSADRAFFINIRSAKGEAVCKNLKGSLQDMLLNQGMIITKDLKGGGLLKVQLRIAENSYPYYDMQFTASNLPLLAGFFGQCDPFMRILKKNNEFGTYYLVYESEVHRNNTSPVFLPFKLSGQRLCDGKRIFKNFR